MFTGTLIEDLIAAVERVEAAHSGDNPVCDALIADGLVALAQQNGEYDSKLFWQQTGVA
jgi:hypothetical protein